MDDLMLSGIDVPTLLAAISDVESSRSDTGLRVEASYLPHGYRFAVQGRVVVGTGRYFRAEVVEAFKAWGPLCCCGVSRWQIQASECWRLGFRGPFHELLSDDGARPWVERKLREIARTFAAHGVQPSVELIGEAWNTGSAFDAFTAPGYQSLLRAAYEARREV